MENASERSKFPDTIFHMNPFEDRHGREGGGEEGGLEKPLPFERNRIFHYVYLLM